MLKRSFFLLATSTGVLIGTAWSTPALSQSINDNLAAINGQVLDQKTSQPVPYAHIEILKQSIGTVTNELGKFSFRIPAELMGSHLKISCIGYKTVIIKTRLEDENLTIKLPEDVVLLSTVTIRSDHIDSTSLALVRQAVKNIETNYSPNPERLEGYFEESLYKDSLFSKPYYLAEAVLAVDKEPYSQVAKQGQVKLLKGRKFTGNDLDSLTTKIIGGPHNAHRFDFVLRREAPLNIRQVGNYRYTIMDTVYYDGHEIVVVTFEPLKNAKGHGTLYITTDTHAVIKGEYNYDENDDVFLQSGLNSLRGLRRIYLKYRTEYFFQD